MSHKGTGEMRGKKIHVHYLSTTFINPSISAHMIRNVSACKMGKKYLVLSLRIPLIGVTQTINLHSHCLG